MTVLSIFRLLQQEEEWKADLEAAIALKESRAQMVQNEKDEMIQEVINFSWPYYNAHTSSSIVNVSLFNMNFYVDSLVKARRSRVA